MPDPTPPPDALLVDEQGASDPTDTDDDVLYDVTTGADPDPELPHQVAGLFLPRRPAAGRRGVLLADTAAGLVVLLDADDMERTFRVRAVRPLAGDPAAVDPAPAGVDDLVRAAYEHEYDVIAAPWAGDTTDPESAAAPPRRRGRGGAR